MHRNLFDHIDIREENAHVPSGLGEDLEGQAKAYDEMIDASPVDIQLLGIGSDGHIAFNEPDDKLIGATHRTGLTESTFHANSGYFEKPGNAWLLFAIKYGLSDLAQFAC